MGAAVCCVQENVRDTEVTDSSLSFDTNEFLALSLPVAGDVNWTPPALALSTAMSSSKAGDGHPAVKLPDETQPLESEIQKQHAKPFVEEVGQDEQAQFLVEKQAVHEFEKQISISTADTLHLACEKRHGSKEGNGGIEHDLPATIVSEEKENRRMGSWEEMKPSLPSGDVKITKTQSTAKARRRHGKKRTANLSQNSIKNIAASEPKPDVHSMASEVDSKSEVPLDTAVAKQLSLDTQLPKAEDAKEGCLGAESGNSSPVTPVSGSGSGRRSRRTCNNSVLRTVIRNLDAHARESLCKNACAQYLASGAILYGTTESKDLCAMGFHALGAEATSFAARSSGMIFSTGTPDCPSRAFDSQKLDFISEASSEDAAKFRRKNLAIRHGINSICCVPYGDGVLEVFGTAAWSKPPNLNVAELFPFR